MKNSQELGLEMAIDQTTNRFIITIELAGLMTESSKTAIAEELEHWMPGLLEELDLEDELTYMQVSVSELPIVSADDIEPAKEEEEEDETEIYGQNKEAED